jgi:CubicO group peptidase (beta-lactamase class C family)
VKHAQVEARSEAQIRELIGDSVSADGPGAAVLIARADRVLLQACYGLADLPTRTPITARTAFDLASVSKQFTAMAALIIVQRGLLSLADNVSAHLPELRRFSAVRPMRITDLLQHTSGLADYPSIWRGARVEANLSNAEYLDLLTGHELAFPTGAKAEYSNSNYIVLACLIERLSEKTFGQFLREEIFDPLGMVNSHVHDNHHVHIPHRARGYDQQETGKIEESDIPIMLVGHSHVFSTIEDMARWTAAVQEPRLVRSDLLAQAMTPGRLDNGEAHEYGFGWYDDSTNGRRSMGHSGSWYGFRSYIRNYLDDRLIVLVLSNNGSFPNGRLVDRIGEAVLNGGS